MTNHLGLEKADDGLGKGFVVGVPDAAHRRLNPGLSQALGVADRQVLATRPLWCTRAPSWPYVGNLSTLVLRLSIWFTTCAMASISLRSIPSQSFRCRSNIAHLRA